MDKRYQVFVSSTFVDLVEERRAVSNVLAKAGHMVAGMELFPATDQQQFEYIKTVIDRSDYYVVIVGARYGSVADSGLSFTEMEFEYARSKNIPVLAFLHSQPGSIAVDKTDQDPVKAASLAAFRQKLSTGRMVEHWPDIGSLCTHVVIAVGNEVTLRPGVGWVRGNNAVDPKILQDLARLSLENIELRERMAALAGGEIHFNPSFAGPEDEIAVEAEKNQSGDNQKSFVVTLPIGELFLNLYDEILRGRTEFAMQSIVGKFVSGRLGITEKAYLYSAAIPELRKIRDQFTALGLLDLGTLQDEERGAMIMWSASEKGKRYASSMRAIRRPEG